MPKQPDWKTQAGSPLGAVEVVDLHSDEVDDTFRIFLGACGDAPTNILLVTDGNGLFGTAVDAVRMMQLPGLLPSTLVVGLGYPSVETIVGSLDLRWRDLTPTERGRSKVSGGGPAFARFLSNELMPWLGRRFPQCAKETTFFGHSLGGLFGTYLLLTRPELFRRYILSSPSYWWDDYAIYDFERQLAGSAQDLKASVFFGIGANETDEGRREESRYLPSDHPGKPPHISLDMVADLRRFSATLEQRSYPNLQVDHEEFPGEFHATAAGVALSRGLRTFDLPR